MKKINSVKDITSGMLVTLRNGDKMTVVTSTIYGNMDKCCTGLSLFAPAVDEDSDDEYWPMSEYTDDFKCEHNLFGGLFDDKDIWLTSKVPLPELDIVQVWSCTCPSMAFANTTEERVLLWSDPTYKANWDELTEEEKNAECSKYDDCRDCPYDNKGCYDQDDWDDEDEPDDDDDDEGEENEKDIADLLDELREACNKNAIISLLFASLADGLPDRHTDYILSKTDKNPERKDTGAPDDDGKSLAEKLYENDKELADDGVSVLERNIALLAAMHAACGDKKL